MIAGNQVYQKAANQALVLKIIRESEHISRIDIARKLGLKKSTVSNLIAELLEEKIVEETTQGTSSPQGGRKPVMLGIQPDYGCVAGVDFQNNGYRVVLTDMKGSLVAESQKTIKKYEDFELHLGDIYQEIDGLTGRVGTPLIGIGMGIPGCIDVQHGIVTNSWAHRLSNYNFLQNIIPSAPVPLLLDNDSNSCAWGELWNHRGGASDNFIYLLARFNHGGDQDGSGQGIGIGLVFNGEVYYGSHFSAGEIKSYQWKNSRELQLGLSYDEYSRIPENPHLLRTYLVEILMNLSVVVSVLNPDRIYVGGDLNDYVHQINNLLAEDLRDYWIGKRENGCFFLNGTMGKNEIALGAARNFLLKLFSIPRIGKKYHYLELSWKKVFSQREALIRS